MLRRVYDQDHEAFRASVREFVDREVWPNVDEHRRPEEHPAGAVARPQASRAT